MYRSYYKSYVSVDVLFISTFFCRPINYFCNTVDFQMLLHLKTHPKYMLHVK